MTLAHGVTPIAPGVGFHGTKLHRKALMADKSAIEWTDATWNPVTGCQKVSPGCDNCYAERITIRFKRGPFEDVKFHQDRLDQPSRWKRPRMIFVNSMGDTFHSKVTGNQIADMFDAMLAAPHHTYQVLTKRPNRVKRWWRWYSRQYDYTRWAKTGEALAWPENIWLGTSVESVEYLARVDRILNIAPLTFISIEPLLGPLTYSNDSDQSISRTLRSLTRYSHQAWVIVGGESGPGARPMDPLWVQAIRDECITWDVPFFFKQWGGTSPKTNGRELDGRTWSEMPTVGITANVSA